MMMLLLGQAREGNPEAFFWGLMLMCGIIVVWSWLIKAEMKREEERKKMMEKMILKAKKAGLEWGDED